MRRSKRGRKDGGTGTPGTGTPGTGTTFQAGELMLLRADRGKLSTLLRSFEQPMGLAFDADRRRDGVGTRRIVWIRRSVRGRMHRAFDTQVLRGARFPTVVGFRDAGTRGCAPADRSARFSESLQRPRADTPD